MTTETLSGLNDSMTSNLTTINVKKQSGPLFSLTGVAGALLLVTSVVEAGVDRPTKFTRVDSIVNTRHNLTQSSIGVVPSGIMDPYRNNYGEVCVYCHTPHGANDAAKIAQAPLWNRTFNDQTYQTYDQLGTSTLTAAVTGPGVNSLTCLSCHDGTLGIDSIINMPGSGSPSATVQDLTSLNQWTNSSGSEAEEHMTLTECMSCHSPGQFTTATDFSMFLIGTDLTNDHPVGIDYPAAREGIDFNATTGTQGNMSFYDNDGDGRADSDEIRFYNTSGNPAVECASCHDPHGVAPTEGAEFNKTFLRVSNDGSGVCQTCHNM